MEGWAGRSEASKGFPLREGAEAAGTPAREMAGFGVEEQVAARCLKVL